MIFIFRFGKRKKDLTILFVSFTGAAGDTGGSSNILRERKIIQFKQEKEILCGSGSPLRHTECTCMSRICGIFLMFSAPVVPPESYLYTGKLGRTNKAERRNLISFPRHFSFFVIIIISQLSFPFFIFTSSFSSLNFPPTDTFFYYSKVEGHSRSNMLL